MSSNITIEVRALPRAGTRARWLVAAWPLLIILLLQAVESTILLHNSPFQDEALYIYAGTQILRSLLGGPPPPENYAQYFSGHPYLYPLLAGALNSLGGIELVRAFSTLCMLVVTVCVYQVTRRFFDRPSAYAAAMLFAFQATTLFLCRLATYDALCLALLALATVVATRASTARDPFGAVLLSPLLVLAVGVKYVALLFVPVVLGLMALLAWERRSPRRALLLLLLSLGSAVLLVASLLSVISHDFLQGIVGTTTARVAVIRAPSGTLLWTIVSLGGLLWLLGVVGLSFLRKTDRRIAAVLLAASVAAPLYHLYKGELVSLHKHVGFGMFFVAPLAGFALAHLSSRAAPTRLDLRLIASLALSLIVFMSGINLSLWYYHTWPDTDEMVTAMRTMVRPVTGRYLCEDVEVVRYETADLTAAYQLTGLDFFEYTDGSGKSLTGLDAYRAAIGEDYFDVVELSDAHGGLTEDIKTALASSKQYILVAKIPYQNSYGSNVYEIWRKAG